MASHACAAGSVPGPAFLLGTAGSIATQLDRVLTGQQSIVGSYSGPERFQAYLFTDPDRLPLAAGRTYRVSFRYRILATPDLGFELLFLSQRGGAAGQWLPSITVMGAAGSEGTATLVNTLGPYDDYQARFNIVGQGAIAVDDIELVDVATDAVVAREDAEGAAPFFRLAAAGLPVARVGRPFGIALQALGGQAPYTWSASDLPLPAGLTIDLDGHLHGRPEVEGSQVLALRVQDANHQSARLSLRLTTQAAVTEPVPSPLAVGADRMALIRPKPYEPAFRMPLGGMRPYLYNVKSHPFASLGRQYIEWNLLEDRETDTVERIREVTDRLFADLPGQNVKAVPRVYLEWPDTPNRRYWPSDLSPGDYSSPTFRARMTRLISRLGEAWNGDPRIAFVETGLIGLFGEQHTPGFATFAFEPRLPAGMDIEFGTAFRDAFPDKGLMNRHAIDLQAFPFGIHWDVFGSFDQGWWANGSTGMTQLLEMPPHAERWKTAPRGGEIDPGLLGEPDWSETSQQNVVRKHTDRLVGLIRRLHWNHLAVLERIDPADVELWGKATQIHNALGARFVIDEARHAVAVQPGQDLRVEIVARNVGSSPFYEAWPLEVALLDLETRRMVWRSLWEGVDLRSWLPLQSIQIRRSFPLPSTLPPGRYALTVAVLDPSGLVPGARFAVQNYWSGGRTPLGPVVVGAGELPTRELAGFDDLALDRSLYYLSAADATATGRPTDLPLRSATDCLFDWAERAYPELLVPASTLSRVSTPWFYRAYAQRSAYLAVSTQDDHVYYLGPLSDNAVLDVGPRSTWLKTAGCR